MIQGEETQAENTEERSKLEETEATGKGISLGFLLLLMLEAQGLNLYGILNNENTEQTI